jgi:hypothetical protein
MAHKFGPVTLRLGLPRPKRSSGAQLWISGLGVINFHLNTCKEDRPMLCSLSTKLGPEDLQAITALEQELGTPLLAFACHDLKPAEVSTDQLAKIQALENKLGLSLVAVRG